MKINRTPRDWEKISDALDKLLDLEAKEKRKAITDYEFGLLERLVMDCDGREKVIEEVSEWIDTQVIAEMIVQHLKEQGKKPTVRGCKDAWLQTLENLGGGVGLAVHS